MRQTGLFGTEQVLSRPGPAGSKARRSRLRISGSYAFQSVEIKADMRYLSLGAGWQSSKVLLSILRGELGTPGRDCPAFAVFADTGWEPARVYEWLGFLKSQADAVGYPVAIVSKGNIRDDALRTATQRKNGREGRFAAMPLHTRNLEGAPMMMRRQCTREYKIEPIEQYVRQHLGLEKGQKSPFTVEAWQGISYDELSRIRVNNKRWIWNRYPLIETRETRLDCLRWMLDDEIVAAFLHSKGWDAPPKSACVGCPYHDGRYWRWLYETDGEAFADAVEFDKAAREGILGWDRPAYLHHQMIPLEEVGLLIEQGADDLLLELDAGWGVHLNECEGMCGA